METNRMRQDLYMVCLHEAAHAKVAHRLGYAGVHFRIWRRTDPAAARAFGGATYVFEETTAEHTRLICLAGVVAELLAAQTPPDDDTIQSWLIDGAVRLSSADAAGAEGFSAPDVARTVELVRTCWPAIQEEMDAWIMDAWMRAD